MNRAVILQHGPSSGIHGQLANQLWNFISIYAYAVERNVPVSNYSFFEYGRYFTMPVGNVFVDLIFFRLYALFVSFIPEKILIPSWRKLYKIYVLACESMVRKNIVFSGNTAEVETPYYLPPSSATPQSFVEKERRTKGTLYFDGWLFRNPIGIEKHRESIRGYFAPRKEILDAVHRFLSPLRGAYRYVVGVHIRQGDYRTWKGGTYFIEQERVRQILDEYLLHTGTHAEETCFVIASDGPIDADRFAGLHTAVSRASAVEDLFILAHTDSVIGSNSSFGDLSAYYGNIPHIIFQNGPIDWGYYRDKAHYFENKYCTLVHY